MRYKKKLILPVTFEYIQATAYI